MTYKVLNWMETNNFVNSIYDWDESDESIIGRAKEMARGTESQKANFNNFVRNNTSLVREQFGDKINYIIELKQAAEFQRQNDALERQMRELSREQKRQEQLFVEEQRKIEKASASGVYRITIPEDLDSEEKARLRNILSERKADVQRRSAFARAYKKSQRGG